MGGKVEHARICRRTCSACSRFGAASPPCRHSVHTTVIRPTLGNHIVRGTFQNASLGYYVDKPYQGLGYMQQGLELLLRLAFTTLGLHRLEANIQPDNERSKKLVAACGFRCEGLSESLLFIDGQWRDHERWSACADRDTLNP